MCTANPADAGEPPEDFPPPVTRSLAGEATPAERAEAERWLDAAPGRRARFAEAARLWRMAASIPSPRRVDGMWRAIARAMHEPEVPGRDAAAGDDGRRGGAA